MWVTYLINFVIFEFKINKSAKQALAQIKEKGYAAPYMADPREKILVGANFSTETRTLTDWVSERLTDTERHKEQD